MANFLVASLIWDITATMDLILIEQGNLRSQWRTVSPVARSLLNRSYRYLRTILTPRWYRGDNVSLPRTSTSLWWAPSLWQVQLTWDSSTEVYTMATGEDSQWNPLTPTLTSAWTLFNRSTQRQWWRFFDGTEEFESKRWDDSVWSSSTLIFRAVVGNLQQNTGVRPDLMFVTKCLSYKLASPIFADFVTCPESVETCLKNTRIESPPDDTCKEYISNFRKWLQKLCTYSTNNCKSDEDKHDTSYINNKFTNTSRDILTLVGPVIQRRGKAHLAHCYVDQFLLTSECRGQGLLPYPVENQKCMLLVHCQLSWFSHKLYWKRLDYHSW